MLGDTEYHYLGSIELDKWIVAQKLGDLVLLGDPEHPEFFNLVKWHESLLAKLNSMQAELMPCQQ